MYQNQLNFCNFRIENFKMIKQDRKLLLTAKYKLINFGKKKKQKQKKNKKKTNIFNHRKKNCVGHFHWVSRIRGKQKLFYFWLKHHEHDIKMKLKI